VWGLVSTGVGKMAGLRSTGSEDLMGAQYKQLCTRILYSIKSV